MYKQYRWEYIINGSKFFYVENCDLQDCNDYENKEDCVMATGGFEASSYYKEDGEIDFELKFVI